MKKIISILLIFTLTFFTISPFPHTYAASFPGTVTGSNGNTKTVTVINAPNKSTLKLYGINGGAPIQTKELDGTNHVFTVQDFGKYYVTSTTKDSLDKDIVSDPSPIVEVGPGSVTITAQGNDSILVTNAIQGAELILYNDRTGYIPLTTIADTNGNGIFTSVPPGLNYKAKQKINGVESPLSEQSITILPKPVQVTFSPTAGATNNQGTITVLESTSGNTIRLYDSNNKLIDSKIANASGGYVFTGLKAGKYYVSHVQNGAESILVELTIGDAEIPVITLIGPNEVTITVGDSYTDMGANFTDNIDPPKIITGVHSITTSSSPGIYYVVFNAMDSNNNHAIEVRRKVTILPEKVTLEPVDTNSATSPTVKDGPNGQIKVDKVQSGAILYLYQDPNGKLIRTITDATSPTYTINDVPVGKDYYVIQEYKNLNGSVVQSEPSARIEVKDTTKPILKLNGDATINLVMGDKYIEYGATATDNVDNTDELNAKIQITGVVNTNIPGAYTITYNVTDNANNKAISITRTVNVSPTAVIAIGSTADIGEVGVKNALLKASLALYSINDTTNAIQTYTLKESETTYVFTNVKPGKYYVVQTSAGFTSQPSNVVEVVDVDRPYITLEGPEKMTFVLDIDKKPYYISNGQLFNDPGAAANDYLEADSLTLTAEMIGPDENDDGNNDLISSVTSSPLFAKKISVPQTKLPVPGVYKITYTAKSLRGSEADSKERIITLAPPKIPIHKDAIPGESPEIPGISAGNLGEGKINVKGLFNHTSTTVTLYNTYGQIMQSKVPTSAAVTFSDVPVGIGYYVTQTVNGIESAPSEPVNVSLHEDAKGSALMTSFDFKSASAYGIIDHVAGTIHVTVPKGTDVTKLKADFTAMGLVKVGSFIQTSGTNEQNFTNAVQYTVTSTKDATVSKTYTVYVKILTFTSNSWTNTLKKTILLSTSTTRLFTLSAAEKLLAERNGASFIDSDRAIHVPFANIIETSNATLIAAAPNLETNESDPNWSKNLTNVTDLKWGNFNTSFMQSIEIEMNNTDEKKFAKLVYGNGNLYALIQPSYKLSNNNVLGLTSEPGTYALIDPISEPVITLSTANGESSFTLSSTVPNSQIYYTTSSSNITFNRSAANKDFNGYSFNGNPSDLSNWTLYTPGEKINSPTGEIYAFVMKDQVMSLISSKTIKTPVEWKRDIPTYKPSHILEITFNAQVEKKVLYSGDIYVIDDSTGKTVPTTLALSNDGKTVQVIPNDAYTPNKQYTLYIERTIKGNTTKKEFLNRTITRTFTIK